PHLGSPAPAPTWSQRWRQLSREYGQSALGVYLVLSALDFPFCFLAVRMLGSDRIARWEQAVVGGVRGALGKVLPAYDTADGRECSNTCPALRTAIWTQLALAYAVHKSFIFIRLPVTVMVTPKVVKTLR
ncbi:hypothetical protein BDY21DRAFT_259570, partial [Lineolata rhizophorae]